jgi:hypothetical protein
MGDGWPSKRERITMGAAVFGGIAVFLAVFAVVVLYKPNAHTASDLKKLQAGMTMDDVKAIAGEPRIALPATTVAGAEEDVWTYALPASHWSVTKADYQVKFYKGRFENYWKVK